MKHTLQHALSITLHVTSITLFLLPLAWFAGGLDWIPNHHEPTVNSTDTNSTIVLTPSD